MPTKIVKVVPSAVLPEYKTDGAVGFDIAICQIEWLRPGETKLLRTGLVVETPPGFGLFLMPRSSTFKKYGISMPHSIGLIDQDYCGPDDELWLQFTNTTDKRVNIPKHERLAQGVFIKVARLDMEETSINQLENPTRGSFGSTG